MSTLQDLHDFIAAYAYFILPPASVVFFIVSLIQYLVLRTKSKREAGSVSEAKLKNAKICLIVSAVIAGVLVVVVVGFIVMLMSAIAYM